MKKILLIISIFIALIYVLPRCNQHNGNACDENFIPYGIRSFDVVVYIKNTNKEFYVGNVPTDYSNAQTRLGEARALAYNFAKAHDLNFKDWGYLCYTVTDTSNCVTKVR